MKGLHFVFYQQTVPATLDCSWSYHLALFKLIKYSLFLFLKDITEKLKLEEEEKAHSKMEAYEKSFFSTCFRILL